MSKNLQKTKAHKSIVRNVEVPVKNTNNMVVKHCSVLTHRSKENNDGLQQNKSTGTGTAGDCKKFDKPELNSCLALPRRMDEIRQMKPKHFANVNELTPRSKQSVQTEVGFIFYNHDFLL